MRILIKYSNFLTTKVKENTPFSEAWVWAAQPVKSDWTRLPPALLHPTYPPFCILTWSPPEWHFELFYLGAISGSFLYSSRFRWDLPRKAVKNANIINLISSSTRFHLTHGNWILLRRTNGETTRNVMNKNSIPDSRSRSFFAAPFMP